MLYFSEIDELIESLELAQLKENPALEQFFRLNAGDVSKDGTVVVGKGGNLFINDGSNHWKDQLSGNIKIQQDQLDAAMDIIENYKSTCGGLGIKFEFVIIPEKDVIVSHLSPNVLGVVSPRRTVQEFIDNISFRPIYPYSQMASVPAGVRLFHRRDSHFNFLGGLIIANEALKSLNVRPITLVECQTDHVPWQDDLSSKWVTFPTMRRQLRRNYSESVLQESVGMHTGLHLLIKSHRVSDGSAVMIYGDSYSWNYDAGLARFLTLRFEDVHFIWQKRINWDQVAQIKPVAIILESAERFLFRGI